MRPEIRNKHQPRDSGIIQLEGDIAVNDRLRLYSREYRSSEHIITDKPLIETAAPDICRSDISVPYPNRSFHQTERLQQLFVILIMNIHRASCAL